MPKSYLSSINKRKTSKPWILGLVGPISIVVGVESHVDSGRPGGENYMQRG